MNRITRIGLVTACWIAISAVGPLASRAAGERQSPGDKPPETVLTGCLKSHGADTAVAGPSGRLYTLEVVDPVTAPMPTTSTPTGTPPSATVTRYSLDNVGKVALEQHADHQVELTGRMQAPSKAARESAAAGAPPAAKPTPGGGHRTFHVTGLKRLGAKCS